MAELGKVCLAFGREGCLKWTLARTTNPYRLAILHMRLGHKEEAFKNLEKAYQEHE